MIAVSGSGIAGLAAALAVLRNQKPLLLVAGRTPATTLQGGVQIAPNGWAALDQLGLGDAARARATDFTGNYGSRYAVSGNPCQS